MLRVWKQAGDGLGGWEPLEVIADGRLSVGFLGHHVGSALLDEGLSMCSRLFDLASAGVKLSVYGL